MLPARPAFSFGPWLWGARTDVSVFGGTALAALALVLLGHAAGLTGEPLPDVAWLVLVLGVDVAHVWSTLFRTYLDGDELRRRALLYAVVPAVAWVLGMILYVRSPLGFWRTVAYLAVFHFVRQQAGWVAIYRARGGARGIVDRIIDDLAVYAATLYPLFVWHVSGPRHFTWLYPGDFVLRPELQALRTPLWYVYVATLSVFTLRQLQLVITERRLAAGKVLVVGTTALTWWVGIVATDSDWSFTVTNVLVHGVPYIALLWAYSRARAKEAPRTLGSRVSLSGLSVFLGVLVLLAFMEEGSWDRLVWHDREWLFGGTDRDRATLGAGLQIILVPLLAVPQLTHYVLDAFLWRRRDTGPAQAAALGFPGRNAARV